MAILDAITACTLMCLPAALQDVILRGGDTTLSLPLYARAVEADAPRAIVLPASEHKLQVRPTGTGWGEIGHTQVLLKCVNPELNWLPLLSLRLICGPAMSAGSSS
jgi:hypothetical protein